MDYEFNSDEIGRYSRQGVIAVPISELEMECVLGSSTIIDFAPLDPSPAYAWISSPKKRTHRKVILASLTAQNLSGSAIFILGSTALEVRVVETKHHSQKQTNLTFQIQPV